MRRLLAWIAYLGFVIGLALLAGCASSVSTVAGFQNNYDYREIRYEEACALVKTAPPPSCRELYDALKEFEKHLHEGARALTQGGPFPLQLEQIEADDKRVRRAAEAVAKESGK